MPLALWEYHVPLALKNVTITHPMSRVYLADLQHQGWCLNLPLCLHTQSFQGWVVFSLPLLEASLLQLFPLRTQLITLPQTTASSNGSWAESSLLVHTVVMMHRVCDGNMHRQSHVRWSAAWRIVIHLPSFLSKRSKFLYNFASQSLGSQPMAADGVAGW